MQRLQRRGHTGAVITGIVLAGKARRLPVSGDVAVRRNRTLPGGERYMRGLPARSVIVSPGGWALHNLYTQVQSPKRQQITILECIGAADCDWRSIRVSAVAAAQVEHKQSVPAWSQLDMPLADAGLVGLHFEQVDIQLHIWFGV